MHARGIGAAYVAAEGKSFYVWMAGAFLLVAFGGFVPTYWAPQVEGAFHAPPVVHIHGALMFIWTCFYFVQAALVASDRTHDHRAWGMAGIALFTAIACVIPVSELAVLKRDEARGMGEAARHFAAVTLCAWPLLVGLFTLAIVNVRRPAVHKRLMTLLMVALMTPAIARVFLTVMAPAGGAMGPPPPGVSIPPALVADLLLVAAMVRDWRILGRPHAVYAIGGSVLLAQQVLTVPFAGTTAWMTIVQAFERLAG